MGLTRSPTTAGRRTQPAVRVVRPRRACRRHRLAVNETFQFEGNIISSTWSRSRRYEEDDDEE
eukprot:13525452-Heterocapsa_arctica.AAC.1